MNKNLKTGIKIFFTLLLLIVSAWYIGKNQEEFSRIFKLTSIQFFILTGFVLLEISINGWMCNNVVKFFGVDMKLTEWFSLAVLNRYSNYLFLKGGPIARGFYLKKRYGLKYKFFFIVVIFLTLIQILCSSIILASSVIFSHNEFYMFSRYVLSCFVLMAGIPFLCLFAPGRLLMAACFKHERAQKFVEIWIALRKRPSVICPSIVLSLVVVLLYSLRIYFIYSILYGNVDFSSSAILASVGQLSFYVSLTPASLGIKEALMACVGNVMGDNFLYVATVAALDRAVIMIWVFSVGFILSFWFSRQMGEKKGTEKQRDKCTDEKPPAF